MDFRRLHRDLYRNQIPVVNLLLPIFLAKGSMGLVVLKKEGRYILPGGYIESGKDWKEVCVEVSRFGARVRMESLAVFWPIDCFSSNHKAVFVLFAQSPSIKEEDLLKWKNRGDTERVVLEQFAEMAFSHHTEMVSRFFRTSQ